MTGIVLSASVRQNLLSLQSTASLLATTQNDLATGNKVNSALDNPTNFFTAQSLNNRASDIGNLLDGIGNGVQVLQAANTGITSLQSLVASAQSIANQVLQSPVGYSTKSNVTSAAIVGATANNLLGTPAAFTDATFTGTAATNNLSTPAAITNATALQTASNSDSLTAGFAANDTITVDGQTLTFVASGATGANQINVTDNVGTLLSKIDGLTGGSTSAVAGGKVVLHTGTTADLSISSSNSAALTALGLSGGVTQARGGGATPLGGLTLTIAATGGGTATAITFGTSAGQVSSLNQLNAALAANNLQATVDSSTGKINITTSNDAASYTIGAITGTAAGAGKAFTGLTAAAAVADPTSQAQRSSLVAQYNNVLAQINTTSQELVLQRHQPVERRYAEADVQRDRQVDAEHHRRHLQHRRPWSGDPDRGHRLPGQLLGQQGADHADRGLDHAAFGSVGARFQPVDRADPPGLLEEPDQCAADRFVQPDPGRHQRGSGQQPGAVDPPVDRGLGAGARQPVAGQRPAAAALSLTAITKSQTAGETPPFRHFS